MYLLCKMNFQIFIFVAVINEVPSPFIALLVISLKYKSFASAVTQFVQFFLIVMAFGWFSWVFPWSRQSVIVTNNNKVGESGLKEEVQCVNGEQSLILLGRSEKAFLRKHHFNRNLKTAVVVTQTVGGRARQRGSARVPVWRNMCVGSGSGEQGRGLRGA